MAMTRTHSRDRDRECSVWTCWRDEMVRGNWFSRSAIVPLEPFSRVRLCILILCDASTRSSSVAVLSCTYAQRTRLFSIEPRHWSESGRTTRANMFHPRSTEKKPNDVEKLKWITWLTVTRGYSLLNSSFDRWLQCTSMRETVPFWFSPLVCFGYFDLRFGNGLIFGGSQYTVRI